MTTHKHLKQLVRSRMQKTGESYSTARRHVIRQAPLLHPTPVLHETPQHAVQPIVPWHFPGNVPATTGLRVLLSHAGVRDPRTGEPLSEALLFGIAGGIGAGMFSFLYEKEDFASFFVAGRHSWQDDLGYLTQACELFGIQPIVRETAGDKLAAKQLQETLAEQGPCIAWVDMGHLPHRAMPAAWSGGGYHLVTVYRIDGENDTALIGDLADNPIAIPLTDLATARARIKKQKNRLLVLPTISGRVDLLPLIRSGLRACHQGLLTAGRMKNFQLDAFRVWGERMHGSKDAESWERVFTRGSRLWRGLTSIFDFIEHYGTGGGLCRPIFAEGLEEAAAATGDERLRALGARYAELGRKWTELANAALPEDVPLFREAKQLLVRKSELTLTGGHVDEVREHWNRAEELARLAQENFPLTDAECHALRARLQQQILSLYEDEVAAARAIAEVAA